MFNKEKAYEEFNEKRKKLLEIMNGAENIIGELDFNQKSYIDALCRRLESDSFKVQVIGTFKNGKSTLINSILGDSVLPTRISPCTAVINEIEYGEKRRAVLHFRNPLPAKMPENIPPEVREHILKYNGEDVPPIDIPADEIEKYAVIPTGKNVKEMFMESPYDSIELYWPLELLKNNVTVTDSPGLNEHAARTRVTMEYLSNADAILFVLAADKLCAKDEMEFVEKNMKKHGYDSVFFVINRFDAAETEQDKEDIMNLAKIKLADKTRFGEEGLFFVSAKNALDGKKNNDQDLLEGSGIPKLENRLAEFLTRERGAVKLSQPASELKRVISDELLNNDIPMRLSALGASLDEITKRRDNAIPALERMKKSRDSMKVRLDEMIGYAIPELEEVVRKFFEDLNTNIPQWIEEFEPQTEMSMNPLKMKENKEKLPELQKEIVEYVQERIAVEQNDWTENTFMVEAEAKAENLIKAAEASMESFYLEMDRIKLDFSGIDESELNRDEVPLTERVMATIVGIFATGIAGGVLGNHEGFSKNFFKGVLVQFGAYMALLYFNLLNPATVIVSVLASLIIPSLTGNAKIISIVKEKVAETVCTELNEANHASGGEVVDSVSKAFYEIENIILKKMDDDIANTQNEIDGIVEEIQKGEENIELKRERLCAGAEHLKKLCENAGEFIISDEK